MLCDVTFKPAYSFILYMLSQKWKIQYGKLWNGSQWYKMTTPSLVPRALTLTDQGNSERPHVILASIIFSVAMLEASS